MRVVEAMNLKTFPGLLLLLLTACGGDAARSPSNSGGTGAAGTGAADGVGGDVTPSGGGGAGNGATGGTGSDCTDAESAGTAAPQHRFANWPMPHPPGTGFPNPFSYDTSQEDVVLDEVTGLMWAKVQSQPLSHDDAADYCGALATGGYCDWRLPTRIEMVSILDLTRARPAAYDPAIFPVHMAGVDRTSSYSAGNGAPSDRLGIAHEGYWRFDRDGYLSASPDDIWTRCVRTAESPPPPEERYTFAGEGSDATVTDLGTGLTWQRQLDPELRSHANALSYCDELPAAGGGWRVPSVKELLTIVDESRVNPASNPEVFPDVPAFDESHQLSFWSDSAQGGEYFAGDENERWYLRLYFGETWSTRLPRTTVTLDTEIFVRCVR